MNHRLALVLLPALLLPGIALSATPPDGALTETSLELSYTTGPMPVPNVNADAGAYVCDATHPCDVFMLTVDLPEDYLERFPRAGIKIVSGATPEYADIDLQIADADGKNLAFARDNPPEQPSLSLKVKSGLTVYQVQIVPGTPVPDAGATITLVPGTPAASKSAAVAGNFAGALGLGLLLPLLSILALRRRRN